MKKSYKINEFVIHNRHGICKIVSIKQDSFSGEEKDFYVLNPIYGKENSLNILISVDDPINIEKLFNKKQVDKFLSEAKKIPNWWNENPLKRTQEFKDIFNSRDYARIAAIIRILNLRKEEKKKISETDKKILENSKLLIYGIIASGVGISFEESSEYLRKRV